MIYKQEKVKVSIIDQTNQIKLTQLNLFNYFELSGLKYKNTHK